MGAPVVLVVDDGIDNRAILSRCVKRAGYEAITAEDGPSALEKIATSPPDLVLLDWMMPGLTGPEILTAIRAQYDSERLPVIMCTARTASKDVRAALAAGANDYITKPVDVQVAIARIEKQLQRRSAVEQLEAMNSDLEEAVATRTRALLKTPEQEAATAAARSEALDEILRLTGWLQASADAADSAMRAACALSIATAARRLACLGATTP